MKRTKILSIILTVVIMLSSISMGAYAAAPKKTYLFRAEEIQTGLLQKTYNLDLDVKVNEKAVNASAYRYYDQLSLAEKQIYDGIVSAKAGMNSSDGNFSFTITDLKTFDQNKSLIRAFAAVIDDVPELYWLLATPYDVYGEETVKGKLTISFEFVVKVTPYSSFAELKNEYNETLNAAKNFPISGTTRYEKLRSIAETLCDIAEYAKVKGNETASNSKIFFPSSCLLSPYKTVCDGYAKAFKMICDANNIPSLVVCGYTGKGYREGHAWNYVLMENNRWYAVDITWMDNDDSDIYDFKNNFLVGSDTICKDNQSFSAMHNPVGDRFIGIYLKYPVLSEEAYDPADAASLLLGDVNLDGKITIVDARYVLQHVASIKTLDAEQLRSADTNQDGKISIIDAKKILQAVAGMNTLAA